MTQAAAAEATAEAIAAAEAAVAKVKSSKRRPTKAVKNTKPHPYQTTPGPHAEAVYEQQLLSRPKAVRASGAGMRKDLLTGTTQV